MRTVPAEPVVDTVRAGADTARAAAADRGQAEAADTAEQADRAEHIVPAGPVRAEQAERY